MDLTFDNGLTTCEIEKRRIINEYALQKGELSNEIVRVDLRLMNSGSGPANDIEVILGFDAKLHLYRKDELRRSWDMYPLDPLNNTKEFFEDVFRRKNRPTLETLGAKMADELGFGIFEDLLGPRRQAPALSNGNFVPAKIEGAQISFRVTKLKQNMTRMLESFYVVFHKWTDVRSIGIDYRINSDEVINDTLGGLKLKVKKASANPRGVAK